MAATIDFIKDSFGACQKYVTFDKTFTLRNADKSAFNFTGYTAKMQVRKLIDSTNVEVELSTTNGRIILGGTAGTIRLSITDEDTANLAAGSYVYALNITSQDGVTTQIFNGRFDVINSVTR